LWWSGIVTASRGAAARASLPAAASQPACPSGDRDGARRARRDGRERARVGRRVDEHAVAGRAQQPQHEVQRVLGAGGDEHLVGRRVDAALAEAPRDRGAQLGQPGGGVAVRGAWRASARAALAAASPSCGSGAGSAAIERSTPQAGAGRSAGAGASRVRAA
jgi:hypothetical protein